MTATFWCPGLRSGGIDGETMRNEETKFVDRQCNPMYVQGVRTFMNSAPTGARRLGRAWPDGPEVGGTHRFTNTAVPRFDGMGCWQQHLLVFRLL